MKKTFAFSLLLLTVAAHAEFDIKWEKLREEENVEVWEGKVKELPVVAFRGVSTIDAIPAKVLSVIYDSARMKEWMSDINDTKILDNSRRPLHKIEYNHTDAPWPVSDRDFVYEVVAKPDPQDHSVTINIQSVEHPDAPAPKGVIRGHLYESRYYIKAIENNTKTYLEVEILVDPKGSLPKWVVNMFQSAWPRKTVNGIRKLATDPNQGVHPDLVHEIKKFETAEAADAKNSTVPPRK